MVEVEPIRWRRKRLQLLDQRLLPQTEKYLGFEGARDTARAIRSMVVRGAPAIGVTAAFALAMEAKRFGRGRVVKDFEKAARVLCDARPTAINLAWAVERQRRVLNELLASSGRSDPAPRAVAGAFEAEALSIMEQDIDVNRRMGANGARLLGRHGTGVLTHCNAGALATAGYGTAIGVIRAAWESGREFPVFASETRPYLQGARLTAWELVKMRVPVTLLTDSMVGHLFSTGQVGAVVVGTDRTAANGDVCNKIGTYTIAVLARRHNIPFYVAAPTSSIDLECATGADIPIEQRDATEITHLGKRRIAADGVNVFNPAFDVTPAELVTAIITEEGVVRKNYEAGLGRLVRRARRKRGEN